MVTQPILEWKKDFKRPVMWGSFNAIWGSVPSPGVPCGDLENWVKFLAAFLCANSFLRRTSGFSMSEIEVKLLSLPRAALICNLFSIFEE